MGIVTVRCTKWYIIGSSNGRGGMGCGWVYVVDGTDRGIRVLQTIGAGVEPVRAILADGTVLQAELKLEASITKVAALQLSGGGRPLLPEEEWGKTICMQWKQGDQPFPTLGLAEDSGASAGGERWRPD
jgi:hypothetical protein